MKKVTIRNAREARVIRMNAMAAMRMVEMLEDMGWKEVVWEEDGKVVRLLYQGAEEVEVRG